MTEAMNSLEYPAEHKIELFKKLVPLITHRIGRSMDGLEEEAIAFIIEESFQEPITPDVFLRATLGVADGSNSQDAALQIHNSVYERKLIKIGELIDKNPNDGARLAAIRENITIGHNQTLENHRMPNEKVYIGGVSAEWIPGWHHPIQTSVQK